METYHEYAAACAPKTIVQLEAESNAAMAALSAAETRLRSLESLRNLIMRLEDIDMLTAEDESDIASLRHRADVRRPLLAAEYDRLEDVALAAQRALDDAPEEAA